MKQIASAYTYNKTTGVITLTGVNIDRDQLLLIVNTTRNVTYYNFADSATTLQAFTQGANTSLTLNSSVITASSAHANGDALIVYYDDQASTVTAILGYSPHYDSGGDALRMDLNAINGFDSAPWLKDGGGNVPISANAIYDGDGSVFGLDRNFPIEGSVDIASLPAVTTTNYIGRVGPAQATSVVAPAAITSTTPSTILVTAVTIGSTTSRRSLTVFNEGPALLYIAPGATCTTTLYQVRLAAGDFWECPEGQLDLEHRYVFGGAGNALRTSTLSSPGTGGLG